jgi:hypothetical protein
MTTISKDNNISKDKDCGRKKFLKIVRGFSCPRDREYFR